jgi:hypothetical protein
LFSPEMNYSWNADPCDAVTNFEHLGYLTAKKNEATITHSHPGS